MESNGRITPRALRDWCLSLGSIFVLLLMLMFLDGRVRSLVSTRLVERPVEALSDGGDQVVSLVASVAGFARGYTADNGPLVAFTAAGLVLLALMLWHRD